MKYPKLVLVLFGALVSSAQAGVIPFTEDSSALQAPQEIVEQVEKAADIQMEIAEVHSAKMKDLKMMFKFAFGADPKEFNLKDIAVKLKSKLACGGTVKDDNIELQGNHEYRILGLLGKMGFDEDGIDLIKK